MSSKAILVILASIAAVLATGTGIADETCSVSASCSSGGGVACSASGITATCSSGHNSVTCTATISCGPHCTYTCTETQSCPGEGEGGKVPIDHQVY